MTTTRRSVGSPWSSPAFRAYLTGDAVSRLGNGVVQVTFAFAALEVTPDGSGIPMVLLALWISRFVFLAPGGNLPDRIGPIPVMVGADLVRLAAQLLPAFTFLFGNGQLWHLMVSAAIYGAATAFFAPAAMGLLPCVLPPSQFQRANAWLDVTADSGRFAGPALAAVLVVTGGVPLALFFDAATFAVSVVTLAVVARRLAVAADGDEACAVPSDGQRPEPEEVGADSGVVRFFDAVRIMPKLPFIVAAIAISVPVQIGLASVSILGPIIAEERLGGVELWGVVATCLAAGSLVGAVISSRVRGPMRGLLTVVLLGMSMPLQLVALAFAPGLLPGVVVIAGVLLLAEVLSSIAGVTQDTLVQLSVPHHMLSRVSAVEKAVTTAMVPLGLAITFPLAELLGRTTYLTGLAGLIVVTAIATSAWAVASNGVRDRPLALVDPGAEATSA